MYKAKVTFPSGEEFYITAKSEWALYEKIREIVGRVNANKFTSVPLKGGHTLIRGGGFEIILYCQKQ